ncbi:MAG TPA: carbon-nitrogen hydrolase family protein [Usitatibacter sp.]|nr:carbon-nitrogen hydrolase family protein [Usitatibacter sp.]
MSPHPAYKVALMHASCAFLDTPATIDKACALIREAARNGARLVAFAETYVSFFPVWCALRAPIYNHDFFKAAAASAIRIDGAEIAAVRAAAREAGVAVSLGFNEGTEASVGCIWNANVFIGPDGAILNHHRKMVPTFWEKLVWANGDGAGLRVCGTDLGRIGMLVCGENTNPLARFTMIAQGEQVHVASFPPVWPTRDPREAGRYDLASATRIRCGAHAFEGKLFNLVVSSWMDRRMRDALVKGDAEIGRILDDSPRGVSMVLGPTGEPVSDIACDEERIVYAQVDLAQCVELKQIHDLAGYYNRFDIFKLTVDRSANRPVRFDDENTMAAQETAIPVAPGGDGSAPGRDRALA